jgi:LPS export ABC transporter protein LptC
LQLADMHRLAQRILIVVVLFVVAVGVMLVVRSRAARVESVGPRPSSADLVIKEVRLEEEESSGVRWQLIADQALIYDKEGRTALRKPNIRVLERDRSWTVVGEEGDLYQDSKDVEIRRNVVLTSDDGLRIETTVLRWQAHDKRLWTDVPVRIFRDGTVIDGKGLDVQMDEETTTVQGRVHATFPGRKNR